MPAYDLSGHKDPHSFTGVKSLDIPLSKSLKGPKFYKQLPLPKGGQASFMPGMGDDDDQAPNFEMIPGMGAMPITRGAKSLAVPLSRKIKGPPFSKRLPLPKGGSASFIPGMGAWTKSGPKTPGGRIMRTAHPGAARNYGMAVNENDLAGVVGALPRGVKSLSIPTHKNLKGPKFYKKLPLPKGGAASFIPGMGDYGPAGWTAQGWGMGALPHNAPMTAGVKSLRIPLSKNLKGPKFYKKLALPKGGSASFIPGMGDVPLTRGVKDLSFPRPKPIGHQYLYKKFPGLAEELDGSDVVESGTLAADELAFDMQMAGVGYDANMGDDAAVQAKGQTIMGVSLGTAFVAAAIGAYFFFKKK